MKAYKIEVLVLDFEGVGEGNIVTELENMRFVSAYAMNTSEADIGQWSDDHPLNHATTWLDEAERLFRKEAQ